MVLMRDGNCLIAKLHGCDKILFRIKMKFEYAYLKRCSEFQEDVQANGRFWTNLVSQFTNP